MRGHRGRAVAFALLVCGGAAFSQTPAPRYQHVVVVIEENHAAGDVLSSPYLASLADAGMVLSRSFAVAHPSQPNYLALFSGSTQAVRDDWRHDIIAPNLATALIGAGLSFATYSEGLPWVGFRGDFAGRYARKHNPCASFQNVPGAVNLPFTAFPSSRWDSLPTVSFVVPDLDNDMHDGSVGRGDGWLRANIDAYARWAPAHDSLLVVTFDEGPGREEVATVPIGTILLGARVRQGRFDTPVTHYSLLRMLEEIYGLPPMGEERDAARIDGIWEPSGG
jgi:phosphatidylinositol-3-phosphatase